jgi:hypothetical protein
MWEWTPALGLPVGLQEQGRATATPEHAALHHNR